MEITKELKEKLLGANSAEEVKALLGNQVTENEADLLFQKIRKRKEADDLKTLDDDSLEDVVGGIKNVSGKSSPEKSPIYQLLRWLFGD